MRLGGVSCLCVVAAYRSTTATGCKTGYPGPRVSLQPLVAQLVYTPLVLLFAHGLLARWAPSHVRH